MTIAKKEERATARIYIGVRPPKNWRLNSVLQKDPDFQLLRDAWDDETNPEVKEQLRLKLVEYKAKVRKEMNLPEEE